MKQIKFWSILLLTVILFVVSCGDGDDTTGGVNNGQSTGSHYGHAWVDLGLSVRWATCNVGASQPHESGNYFAWGETTGYNEGKRNFSAKTYKWYDEGVGYTKYCGDSNRGIVDNKYLVDSEDDAATVNWGGSWRTPHPKEIAELVNNCYWEWTSSYNGSGIKGCIVYKAKTTTDMGVYCNESRAVLPSEKYNISDAHIFLPAVGDYYGTSMHGNGIPNKDEPQGRYRGQFWTSALGHDSHSISYTYYTFNDYTGSGLEIFLDNSERRIGDIKRTRGLTIRAVCPK